MEAQRKNIHTPSQPALSFFFFFFFLRLYFQLAVLPVTLFIPKSPIGALWTRWPRMGAALPQGLVQALRANFCHLFSGF